MDGHARWLKIGMALFGLIGAMWTLWWWMAQPRTPEELFRVRCSTCHELRTVRICEFAPELRPAIVETMRRMHGADEVINDEEAESIRHFLEVSLVCP